MDCAQLQQLVQRMCAVRESDERLISEIENLTEEGIFEPRPMAQAGALMFPLSASTSGPSLQRPAWAGSGTGEIESSLKQSGGTAGVVGFGARPTRPAYCYG